MTIKECAKALGITEGKLRKGIDLGLYPFAKVIKRDTRNTYYIMKPLFEIYMKGERINEN